MQSTAASSSDIVAPFADTPIEISMLSTTSSRYKTYYCIECNHPFLQRDNGVIYRINTDNEPHRAYFDSGGSIMATCAKCSQKYVGYILPTVDAWGLSKLDGLVNHTLQSIYQKPVAVKSPRYIRCLECGHTFCTLADRISKVVDNHLALEYAQPNRLAFIEVRCDTSRCRQRWALIV